MRWNEMGPRERDALVAEKVMGWRWVEYWCGSERKKGLFPPIGGSFRDRDLYLRYSTEIGAAWEVVEELLERGMYPDLVSSGCPVSWNCVVDKFVEEGEEGVWPKAACSYFAPKAICIAALRAVGVEVE